MTGDEQGKQSHVIVVQSKDTKLQQLNKSFLFEMCIY